jgi:hypothetical protein
MAISLDINIKGEKDLLKDQRERLGPPMRLYPVTKDFGERMLFSIEENFRLQGIPFWAGGERWPDAPA